MNDQETVTLRYQIQKDGSYLCDLASSVPPVTNSRERAWRDMKKWYGRRTVVAGERIELDFYENEGKGYIGHIDFRADENGIAVNADLTWFAYEDDFLVQVEQVETL